MCRAFFLAVGIMMLILGGECLVVDKAVLANITKAPATEAGSVDFDSSGAGEQREIEPPDWAPWSLISAGAVVMIYSFTIPARARG